MSRTEPRSGYTIVELLVVIAVIAILTAAVLAVVVRSKEKGRQVACLNNLSQLYKYVIYYVDKHDGRLPHLDGANWIDDLIAENPAPPPSRLLICPSDRKPMVFSVYELSYACNCTWGSRPLTSISHPSSSVLFAEIGRNDSGRVKFCARYAWVFKRYHAFRHFRRMNAMFADGHIRSLDADECTDKLFRPRR